MPQSGPPSRSIQVAANVWILDEVLVPTECRELIRLSEIAGFCPAHASKTHGRDNHEVFLSQSAVRRLLAQRIEARMGNGVRDADPATGLLEVYRYKVGESIAPHWDAPTNNGSPLSGWTAVVYLNQDFAGGATGFPELGLSARGAAGETVIFRQDLCHAGELVTEGTKYVARIPLTTL